MNIQVNRIITGIMSSNQNDLSKAIQQLFSLMGVYQSQYHPMIQQAILFSMESLHEWSNLIKYIQKWNSTDFRIGLVKRMRKRLSMDEQTGRDSIEDLRELFQAYWINRSPKKEESKYIEPIILKNKILSVPLIPSKDLKSQTISTKNNLPNSEFQIIKNPINTLESKQNNQGINNDSNKNEQKSTKKPIALNILKNIAKQQSESQQNISNNIIGKQRKKEGRLSTHDICKLVHNFQSKQPKSLKKKQELQKEEFLIENKKAINPNLEKAKITPVKYNPKDTKNEQQSFSFKKEKPLTNDPLLSQKRDEKKQSKKPAIKIRKQSQQSSTNTQHFQSFEKNLKWRIQQKKDYTQDIKQVIDMKKNITSISIKQAIDFQQSERKSLKKQSSSIYNLQSKLAHYDDETILHQLMQDIGKKSLIYLRTLLE